MAFIGHRCTECGKSVLYCRCGHRAAASAPEVIPTWDIACRPVTTIAEPGTSCAGSDTCGCKACKALYAQLVPS